ncbi:MAG: hypothetical protein U0R51_00315 [Solirubrobacterales bacterium]
MFDPRIYRAALLPAVAALAVVMFSFQPIPNPLPPPVATPTFDGSEAARTARSIVSLAPDRTPGSDGDRAVADLVQERFTGIEGGQVSTQSFDSSFDGEDVKLENVILTLPGISDRTILVVASRDAPEGTGATTSASATATLLGLADDLGRSRREKTMIFASTDGGGDSTDGVDELIDALPQPENVEAAFAISQPGVPVPEAPFVIGSGSGPDSPSAQLVQTARDIATAKFAERDPAPGPWVGLSRLAFPGGLGEQVALRRAGIEALGISAHGERPVPAGDAGPEAISSETLDASGATMLELMLTLDHAEDPVDQGPDEYIRIGDNLVPGWTLSLLAVALLLAPLLTAGDTWLREHRNDWRVRKTLFWAGERVLIPLAALVLTYLLGFVGLIPDPAFPYDPALHAPGAAGPVAFAALAGAVAIAALLVRPMRTPLDAEPQTLAAAAGLLTGVSVLCIWLINPYLALLLTPTAHIWLLAARAAGPPRAVVLGIAGLVSLVPALLGFATWAAQLGLGLSAPWHLLLMIADHQIGFLLGLLWCGVLGGLIAVVSSAGGIARSLPPIGPRGSIRGAGSHAGPGALGASPPAVRRRD